MTFAFQFTTSRFPFLQTTEGIEREKFAECFLDLARTCRSQCRRGAQLPPYNPALRFFPFSGVTRPAGMLRPCAFFARIPVAVIFPSKLLPLPIEPTEIFDGPRDTDTSHRALSAFVIHPEADGHCLRRYSDVKLPGGPALCLETREKQIHLRSIRSFIVCKSNIAIDARETLAGAAANAEFGMQLSNSRRERVEQPAKRHDNVLFVPVTILVHPCLGIILPKVTKESKCLRAKNRFFCPHFEFPRCANDSPKYWRGRRAKSLTKSRILRCSYRRPNHLDSAGVAVPGPSPTISSTAS